MPKTSDAQLRATLKYQQDKCHMTNVKFFPKDEDLWEHLCDNEPKATYIKGLIRDDMERGQNG